MQIRCSLRQHLYEKFRKISELFVQFCDTPLLNQFYNEYGRVNYFLYVSMFKLFPDSFPLFLPIQIVIPPREFDCSARRKRMTGYTTKIVVLISEGHRGMFKGPFVPISKIHSCDFVLHCSQKSPGPSLFQICEDLVGTSGINVRSC